MTVRDLAAAVGTSPSTISDLENFKLQLSPKWLRRLSPVLKVQQGHILDYSPEDLDTDIIDIWSRIADDDRGTALRMLRSLTQTGTDG